MKAAIGVLLVAVALATGHRRGARFWGGWGRGRRPSAFGCSKESFDQAWLSTGTVPDRLSEVPDAPLYMAFGGVRVTPNMTLDTSQMLKKPVLKWKNDPNALYTLLIEDNDITNQPIKYAHWLVTNIKGDDVYNGEEIATYIPSYHFELTPEGGLDTTRVEDGGVTNRHLVLVYKQKGRIDMSGQSGCNAGLLEPPRVIDHVNLQADYDLEGPIAGTFYRVGYSEGLTEQNVCYLRKCLGFPLPSVIAGVNDGPECISPNEGSL